MKIFTIKPFPATYEKFVNNLSLNPALQKIVTVTNCAMGDAPATLKMYRDCETNSGSNRILVDVSQNSGDLVEVPVLTVDKFVSDNAIQKIDFVKIDVEGFEMNVLKGAVETLKKYLPALFIELNDKSLQCQGSSAADLVGFLKNLGYKIFEDGKVQELSQEDMYKHIDIICKA